MFGKVFASLYKGSMVGKGPLFFTVWNFVIANMELDSEVGYQIELNPDFIARVIGKTTEEDVEKVIKELCAPDPKSTTPDEQGRRLIYLAGFSYRVVNGLKYRNIRDAEDRRKQNREAQARFREKEREKEKKKQPKKGKPLPGEPEYVAEQNRIARAEDEAADREFAGESEAETDERRREAFNGGFNSASNERSHP